MTNLIENRGTGSIEQSGTGSIEHSGTGSIEHSGTGSIEQSGSGRIARGLALSAALACVFSGVAIAETASYATSHGTIDVHSNGSEVRISWHYNDGANRQFLVGAASMSNDYGLIQLKPVASFKIESDGSTATGSSYEPSGSDREAADGKPFNELGAQTNFEKIETDGSTNDGSSIGDWGVDMELIFTDSGIEAVATRGSESIVLDLNNSGEFSQAVVFLGTEAL